MKANKYNVLPNRSEKNESLSTIGSSKYCATHRRGCDVSFSAFAACRCRFRTWTGYMIRNAGKNALQCTSNAYNHSTSCSTLCAWCTLKNLFANHQPNVATTTPVPRNCIVATDSNQIQPPKLDTRNATPNATVPSCNDKRVKPIHHEYSRRRATAMQQKSIP